MEKLKKIGWLIAGWFFITLGILGLFLPILQGILFIAIGIAILSSRSEWVRRILKDMELRFPHLHERVERLRERLRNSFKNRS
ncbi:MAG: PGPGW domain-containing protein [Thermodesulfobacteriota bacterium]